MAQEVKPTTTAPAFVWKIKNFSMLTPNKLYSDAFVVGGYKWRLLVFPKGNKVDDHLSLYLDVADSSKLPDGWSIDIESLSITVVNKILFKYSVVRASKHRFHATEGDWGFKSFMPLEKLHDPDLGYLIDNTLVVGAHLSISAPPSPHLSYNDRASRFIKMVHFRSLDTPMEDGFCLELLTLNTYDDVVKTVANRIGFDDPSKIRLTSHNCYSHHPNPQPIQYRGVDHLSDMLLPYNQTSDILYYEVLDIPLPELQGLKNLQVAFHHATKDEVVIHNIRLPKQSTVQDLINELKTKVELSHTNAELRLLEVIYHKIYKIFPPNEKLENINDQYWTLRAEEIPEEEKNLGPHDQLIHVYHFNKQSQMQVQNFGEPFFLVINEGETLGEVKVRIQKKLQVPDEEFSKWKFAFLSLGHPEYLQDSDIVFARFQRRDVYGAWEQYLGLEHSDNAPKRSYATKQTSDKVLDIPLPELQGLKSLKVAFHHTTKDEKLMAQQVKPTTVKSTSFSWVIKNFTNSKTKKLYSDVFLAFGYKWRLFVDPKGNNGNVLWVYLEVVDFPKLPSDWSINAQLDLTLVNQILKEDSIKKYGKCKFCAGQTDWGFPYFLPLTELSKGYLVNDTVIVEIDVSEESTLRKLNIFAESTPLFQMPTPPDTPSVSFPSSSMSSQPSSTLLEKSKNLLTELSTLKITGKSTSASSSGISGSAMQQERKALKHYLALSLEAIDQANGFNEIEKITLLLLQHSANSHERTILRDFVSRVAALKEIVPATKSSIENVRAQNMSLVGKKADLRARLKQGQEKLCSLEVQLSKLLQEKRELKEDVAFLMTEEGEPRRMNSVALELEKMNQKVSKDIEEWREISKEAEQASNQWLQAREKLAQANLSWQLFKQNLELCEN